MMHTLSGFGFPVGWVFQLLIMIIFFGIVFWLIRSNSAFSKTDETAEDILDKRLAKGELTIKQYNSLKKEIMKS